MISKNATLDEMIQYFYDNYDFYMKKAEENTKYDSLGRIILEDYGDDDSDIETAK